jgi:hypothetical protein
MDKKMFEGLVILEYLNLGIMPFYPNAPKIATQDKKSKRKFRKLWRKVAAKRNQKEWLVSPHGEPTGRVMWYRKIIVHDWIKNKVRKKYNLRQKND